MLYLTIITFPWFNTILHHKFSCNSISFKLLLLIDYNNSDSFIHLSIFIFIMAVMSFVFMIVSIFNTFYLLKIVVSQLLLWLVFHILRTTTTLNPKAIDSRYKINFFGLGHQIRIDLLLSSNYHQHYIWKRTSEIGTIYIRILLLRNIDLLATWTVCLHSWSP